MRRLKAAPLVALIAVATMLACLPATSASAAYHHPTVAKKFGSGGTSATTIGGTDQLAFNQTTQRLYVLGKSPPKIHGFNASIPGTYTPLGGSFPLNVANPGGVPDLAVDNTSGNLFYLAESSGLYGFTSTGTSLFPGVSGFGDPCGVATDSAGNAWVGDYGAQKVKEYNPSGVQIGAVNVADTGSPCHVAFDRSNDDMYVADYGGSIYKYTAASGYKDHTNFAQESTNGLAVDSTTHIVYVANYFGRATAYSPGGNVVEQWNGIAANGIAIDQTNGVVYISEGNSDQVWEYPPVVVPDLTTSNPTGFATLHGHVDPVGGGDITGCHFDFVPYYQYYGGDNYTDTIPCSPAIPPNYSGPKDVSADLTGLVTGELLYHYRLVVSNANGTTKGDDHTFTPHFVTSLQTDPATGVTRNGATLNGEFVGTNDDTNYYFEWGTSSGNYTDKSATPPGDPAGKTTGTTPLTFNASSLLPGTTYYYRVVASNSQGTSNGDELSFTTPPAVIDISTDPADPIFSDNADLNGSFTGEGIDTQYHFDYGTSTSYGSSTPTVDLPSPSGPTSATPANVTNLQPLHTYHFRFVATNSFGTAYGADRTFTTTSPPVVITTSSSGVNADSADLHAVINPEGFDTEYHFEYGHTTLYGSRAPASDVLIPASNSNESVSLHLTGLDGGVYHFRVVATSVKGETDSTDQSFNFYPPVCPNAHLRQQSNSDTLPDCRAYELVSAPDAGNTIIYGANGPFSPTATSPSRLGYMGSWGAIQGVGSPINDESGDLYMATRTDSGWQTKYVGLPASQALEVGGPPWTGTTYPSPWTGQIDTLSNPSMSRIVQWDEGHRISDYPYNTVQASNAPYVWDSTTGARLDRWPTNLGSVPGGENFEGKTAASADLSHFIFTSDIPFAPGGVSGDMYDNDTVNDTLSIISRDSGNAPIQADPVEASKDGSHVLMTVGGGRAGGYVKTSGPGQLYMRVNDAVTYDIAPGHAVQYLGMTPDGSKVYFTSDAQLTADDTDTSTDIYQWDETSNAPGHLTRVSTGDFGSGNADINVIPITFNSSGGTPGYSDAVGGAGGSPWSDNTIAPDNGDIYFLSGEQLQGNNGVNSAQNLYVYRNGIVQFIAALDPNAKACTYNINRDPVCSSTAVARLETSPNDSHMAFLTASKVTNYDNAGLSEMYTYTPATGELRCASCLLNGDPPLSNVTTSHNGRFMTDDGRTFFDTTDPLVPQDTNQAGDTYEYVDGRPQLITGGTAPSITVFGVGFIGSVPGLIGVSADGTDVYFSTYDTLVGQDRNGDNVKVYDARTGGGFPFVAPPPDCAAADECHGPGSSPPLSPSGGTGSDLGSAGNLQSAPKAQHRHRRHKKAHHRRHRNG